MAGIAEMADQNAQKTLESLFEDDMTFYEREIMPLSDDEQKVFFRNNPEFMKDYPVDHDEVRIDLLRDKMYRGILRKIREQEMAR